MQQLLRNIPSVDACMTALEEGFSSAKLSDGGAGSASSEVSGAFPVPHMLLRELVREFLEACRQNVRKGKITDAQELGLGSLLPQLQSFVRHKSRPVLKRVINATGVVIHTNLGRSVLAEEAQEAVALAAGGYCNLEYDLEAGHRGSRHSLVKKLITTLTGAEDALVVNNNAAAVYLMLNALASQGEVIVSRGQLVEIGGSFRIPEVMSASGAVLKEVGTTNRTHAEDYEKAITENTRALLRVHTSNYRIVGFHSEVEQEELSGIARKHNIPCLVDLGSGSLVDFSSCGLVGEPTVSQVLKAGADIVTFSGDKVLGGPQAGIIAGKAEYIQKMAKNHMLRALRPDKMTLAALEATLRLYLDPMVAKEKIPTFRAMTLSMEYLRGAAAGLSELLRHELAGLAASISVQEGDSCVGGGSFPGQNMPSVLVQVAPEGMAVETLRQRLLRTEPPLVGRVEDNALLLDVRTLHTDEYQIVADVLRVALSG